MIKDFSFLVGLPLKQLDVSGTMFQDSDLAMLRGKPLEGLALGFTKVSNLSPLAGMPLKILAINNTRVSDISSLKDAPLVKLYIKRTNVTDLSILKNKHLAILMAQGTKGFGAGNAGDQSEEFIDNPLEDQTGTNGDMMVDGQTTNPVVFPVSSDQTPLETLSQQALNATAWALAPLGQAVPGNIRQYLTYLREDLLDGEKLPAAKANVDAYKLGAQLCNNLLAALDERDQALVKAGYRAAQANANTKVTSQALEARRNYMMSWPQYAREQDQRAEIQRQQNNGASLVKESVKVDWANKSALLRKSLDAQYAKYRDALRKGNL